jgi:hypothetical protein
MIKSGLLKQRNKRKLGAALELNESRNSHWEASIDSSDDCFHTWNLNGWFQD